MKATGDRLFRQAQRSKPLTSAGLPGIASCSPGVFQYHACGLPECCAAPPPRRPYNMWNTTGAVVWLAELEYAMAASLTICGIASYENVAVDRSTIGRSPIIAAP